MRNLAIWGLILAFGAVSCASGGDGGAFRDRAERAERALQQRQAEEERALRAQHAREQQALRESEEAAERRKREEAADLEQERRHRRERKEAEHDAELRELYRGSRAPEEGANGYPRGTEPEFVPLWERPDPEYGTVGARMLAEKKRQEDSDMLAFIIVILSGAIGIALGWNSD